MTSDTIALIFGWVMDGLAFSAIVYGVLDGWHERSMEKMMESDIPNDEWYECEM